MDIHDFEALQPHVTLAPALKRDEEPTEDQICGYFNQNENYSIYCPETSTCSTPLGGKSWGCCDSAICYIPATCEDAGAAYCGGTPSSRCTRTPIMQCTYGASSRCVAFVRQTASDDPSKLTSWGCQETTTTYIIDPPLAARTGAIGDVTSSGGSSATESSKSSSTSSTPSPGSSGLSTDAKIILGVLIPVLGIAVLAGVFLYFRRRKQRKRGSVEPAQRPQEREHIDSTPEVALPPPTIRVVHEVEGRELQQDLRDEDGTFEEAPQEKRSENAATTFGVAAGERLHELNGDERLVEVQPPANASKASTERKVYELGETNC
ncbi:hypothetical protein EDB81DRAFT_900389 [Dactylonectria macrodidyma]|uniref:Uncharacterized protein n=1 Tax=Dactylonectria macrodidyma TaxID=307937 RepID=A0A9P9ENV4_9HYPO|nr:hypothetical protein EDB81DRAFT_900389 [Dactylonectria macrodidyma]